MAIDFSSLGATPAHTGKIDFSAIGGIPAVGQDEPTDDTTALGAAGRGAVSMLPLGNQAYSAIAGAAEKEPYLQERQELEKETKSDIENHEPSRLAGQAAGLVAPALLTGGASAPESLLGAAGQGAAVGAGFGAGNAIDTLASGGSGAKAAGDIALGAGLGATGGAVGQKLAGLAESAVPGVEDFAAKKAIQGAGMESDQLGNMTPEARIALGKMLIDKKIIAGNMSKQQMLDAASSELTKAGDTIGKIGNQATELGLTTDTKPILDILGEKYQAASQLSNPDEVRNALFYKRGMADIITMANKNGAERVAPDILTDQPNSFVTFDQLAQLKKSYGPSAFINGTVKNPAAADVYGQLAAGQKSIIAKATNNPNLPAQLKDAMATYSQLHPVVDGLRDLVGREAAGNLPAKGYGMAGKLVGQLPGESNPVINILTSLGLLAHGNPLLALGASTATLQNAPAMSSAAQAVANNIPGIASKIPLMGAQLGSMASAQNMGEIKPVSSPAIKTMPNSPTSLNVNHPALAAWKPTFDKNAAQATDEGEVQKSQAVTDFVLSQRDPAYAAAKQKASDEPVTEPSPSNSTGMANGGVVSNDPDAMGSLAGLQRVANQIAEPRTTTDVLPTRSTQKFNEPFNSDMADKLKAFLSNKEDENAK